MRSYTRFIMLLFFLFNLTTANAAAVNVITPADRDLLIAVGQGQTSRVEALLKSGANVNTLHPLWRLTPVQVAAEIDYDMVKLLVARGAEVNVADVDGITPLIRAVVRRDPRMVKLLLDSGAQINVKDHRGHTALTHATLRSDADTLKLLIAQGAEVDVVTAMGTTPWSIAQRMREAALDMREQPDTHHAHKPGQASHAMRNKQESLAQTQAVLDVLVATGVQRPQQAVKFNAMEHHRH